MTPLTGKKKVKCPLSERERMLAKEPGMVRERKKPGQG
jgi:hypothetical protein